MKLEVGMKVYTMPCGSNNTSRGVIPTDHIKESTITKIGRKYFYLNDTQDEPFGLDNLKHDCRYYYDQTRNALS